MRLQQVISKPGSRATPLLSGLDIGPHRCMCVAVMIISHSRDRRRYRQRGGSLLRILLPEPAQRNFQGTGLGLAICEKLISMMDGDMPVDSRPAWGKPVSAPRIPLYGAQYPVKRA